MSSGIQFPASKWNYSNEPIASYSRNWGNSTLLILQSLLPIAPSCSLSSPKQALCGPCLVRLIFFQAVITCFWFHLSSVGSCVFNHPHTLHTRNPSISDWVKRRWLKQYNNTYCVPVGAKQCARVWDHHCEQNRLPLPLQSLQVCEQDRHLTNIHTIYS